MVRGGRTEGVGLRTNAGDSLVVGRAYARPTLDSRLRGNDAVVRFGPAVPLSPLLPLPRCLPLLDLSTPSDYVFGLIKSHYRIEL